MSEFMGDRLGEIIHHYRMTMNSFAKKLGLSSNTVITKAVKERQRGVNQELLQKILRTFPEIDALWLVSGEGNMLRSDPPKSVCEECEKKDQIIETHKRSIERLEKTIDLSQKTIEHLLEGSKVDIKANKSK